MKGFFIYIIMCIGLIACDVEFSDNGDLDGFWQLSQVDTIQTGKMGDFRDKGLTWAFQGKILEVRDVQKVHQDIILSFSHTDHTLRVYSPYLVDRENDDLRIEDQELLKPYGISMPEESFAIKELKSDKMILESGMFRLYFLKY